MWILSLNASFCIGFFCLDICFSQKTAERILILVFTINWFPLYICRYQHIHVLKYFSNLFTKKVNNCIINIVTVNQIQQVNNNMELSSWFLKVGICYNCQGFWCVLYHCWKEGSKTCIFLNGEVVFYSLDMFVTHT